MSTTTRNWLLALAACVALVALCVLYLDQPVVHWATTHFWGTPLWSLAEAAFAPLDIVVALALVVSIVGWGWRKSTGRPVGGLRLPMECVVATALALPVTFALKFSIGHSQANQFFMGSGIAEFSPFHGGEPYMGFPSTTMAIAATIVAVLWLRMDRSRMIAAAGSLVLILLAGALIVTNGHWLSEIVGGVFVGAWLGWLVLRWNLFRTREHA